MTTHSAASHQSLPHRESLLPVMLPGFPNWLRGRIETWRLAAAKRRSNAILRGLDARMQMDIGVDVPPDRRELPDLVRLNPHVQLAQFLTR